MNAAGFSVGRDYEKPSAALLGVIPAGLGEKQIPQGVESAVVRVVELPSGYRRHLAGGVDLEDLIPSRVASVNRPGRIGANPQNESAGVGDDFGRSGCTVDAINLPRLSAGDERAIAVKIQTLRVVEARANEAYVIWGASYYPISFPILTARQLTVPPHRESPCGGLGYKAGTWYKARYPSNGLRHIGDGKPFASSIGTISSVSAT